MNENESSFIDLTETSLSPTRKSSAEYAKLFSSGSYQSINQQNLQNEFLHATQHTSSLIRMLREGDYKSEQNLCEMCVERLHLAINDHTVRLKRQSAAYVDAVEAEEQKQDTNTLRSMHDSAHGAQTILDSGNSNEQIRSFLEEEIKNLQAAFHEQKSLSEHLTSLLIEQENRSQRISMEEDRLMHQMNDLELQTKNFQVESREIAMKCLNTQQEMEALKSTKINSALFLITNYSRADTDKNLKPYSELHASKYPLINGLRLSHNSNENLQWSEIQTAWAQVALLLFFTSEILNFSSKDFRIIPLTDCAKIIQITSQKKKIEHTLGQETNIKGTRSRNQRYNQPCTLPNSLISLNHFIHQLVECALSNKGSSSVDCNSETLPFKMSPTNIGQINLRLLGENDDEAWLDVINSIAANLDWLLKLSRLNSEV